MPTKHINHWLTKTRIRRLQYALVARFIRRKYRDCVDLVCEYAYGHEDWQKNFGVFITVGVTEQIEEIEVRES